MKNQNNVCKQCGSSYIVNKKYQLCLKCNNMRLHGSIYGKQYKYPPKNKNPLKKAKNSIKKGLSDKAKEVIRKDEETYEKVFSNSNHRCEECGKRLNTEFRDEDGIVLCRWRYAHRWAKSIYPEWRHEVWNIINLCLDCHQKYDFADVKNMKVYEESLKLKEEHLNDKRN